MYARINLIWQMISEMEVKLYIFRKIILYGNLQSVFSLIIKENHAQRSNQSVVYNMKPINNV